MHICPQEIMMVLAGLGVARWAGAWVLGWARTRDRKGWVAAIIGALSILAMMASLAAGGDAATEAIRQAAQEQGVPLPKIVAMQSTEVPWAVAETALALIAPCRRDRPECQSTIIVLVDRIRGADLMCVARHEIGHLKLGHRYGADTEEELAAHHRELSFWLRARYGDGRIACRVER